MSRPERRFVLSVDADPSAKEHLFSSGLRRQTDPGVPLLHLTYGAQREGSRMGIEIHATERTRSVKLHTHDYFELALVEEGTAEHHYGTRSYRVEPADLLAISPFIPHGYTVDDATGLRLINVNFGIDALGDALNDPAVVAFVTQVISGRVSGPLHAPGLMRPAPPAAIGWVRALKEEYERHRPGRDTALQSLLRLLLVELHRSGLPSPELSELHGTRAILRILPELHALACQDLSVTELARMAGLSPGYFGRQFRRLIGETVTQYIQRIRVFEAVRLLRTTDWGIEDVAACVGYRDTGTFRNVFKKYTGRSPSHYRT